MTSVGGQPCCPALEQPTTHTSRKSLTLLPTVFVAPYEPLPPPSFLVVVWQMPPGVMVFASCRVGGSKSLGLGLW